MMLFFFKQTPFYSTPIAYFTSCRAKCCIAACVVAAFASPWVIALGIRAAGGIH